MGKGREIYKSELYLVEVCEAGKADNLSRADVQYLKVAVQRCGEIEGCVPGVDDTQVCAQLLAVQRHCVHRLEGVWPTNGDN